MGVPTRSMALEGRWCGNAPGIDLHVIVLARRVVGMGVAMRPGAIVVVVGQRCGNALNRYRVVRKRCGYAPSRHRCRRRALMWQRALSQSSSSLDMCRCGNAPRRQSLCCRAWVWQRTRFQECIQAQSLSFVSISAQIPHRTHKKCIHADIAPTPWLEDNQGQIAAEALQER